MCNPQQPGGGSNAWHYHGLTGFTFNTDISVGRPPFLCFVFRLLLTIAMYIPGCDNESKLLRKTLMQNCNLMAVLVFRSISESVRSRLKSLEDVVNAGADEKFHILFQNG